MITKELNLTRKYCSKNFDRWSKGEDILSDVDHNKAPASL